MPEPSTQTGKTIVLKFGGSVLLDERRLRIAVHEIYRWRREGWRVVAVVSALAGRTEELIARCQRLGPGASDRARAAVVAGGELESASLLGVHLDRAGIPATVLSPGAVGLIAHGSALDADPISIEPRAFHDALEFDGVVVFPGFVAIDARGAPVTLGRGGSDLTAVYLTHALSADRCRLIKDVDALYESDPAISDPPPRRYGYASYADALATDGSILQHKAIRFAQSHGVTFELSRFNATRPTTIGDGASRFDDVPDRPRRLSLAFCGLGTVGGGVAELADQLPEYFEIIGGACRSPDKHAGLQSVLGTISDDAAGLAGSGADVVLELIGGVGIAREVTLNALASESHVISANKALIAREGLELNRLANGRGVTLRYSASVGGSVPVLKALGLGDPVSVTGVLNGTANFVLGALEAGRSLDEAVREAQRLGFAEADPIRDLDGRDALDKLLVIAQTLGWGFGEDACTATSIDEWMGASEPSYPARQIASLDAFGARVTVEAVTAGSVLAGLTNEWNAVVITKRDGSTLTLRGKGAGRWPTSESVFADLLELSRVLSVQPAGERRAREVACV